MHQRPWLWYLAKGLEGIGLLAVLWGLVVSVSLGMDDEGLESMKAEGYGLAIGGVLFLAGWAIERGIGSR